MLAVLQNGGEGSTDLYEWSIVTHYPSRGDSSGSVNDEKVRFLMGVLGVRPGVVAGWVRIHVFTVAK